MRTKLFSALFAMLVLVGIQSAQAQIRFGVKAGLNLADVNGKNAGESFGDETDMIVGFHVGGVADITFAESFYFQPGLLFSTKGSKSETENSGVTTTTTTNVSWLEIPLNLGYRIDAGGAKINLGVGPYVGFGLGGKIKAEAAGIEIETDVEFGDDDNSTLRGFDYGVNIGAGVEFSNFAINAQYGLGLANLRPKGDSDNSAKNGVIGISVGYFFGGE